MNYYKLDHSLNSKEIGCFPQSESMAPGYMRYSENSVYNIDYTKKIDFEPNFKHIQLSKRSKVTDMLNTVAIRTDALVISQKMFAEIQKHKVPDTFQIFDVSVLDSKKNNLAYLFFYIYDLGLHMIDFKAMNFRKMSLFNRKDKIPIAIESQEHFQKLRENDKKNEDYYSYLTDQLRLIEANIKTDIFRLAMVEPASGYYVSERLKETLEASGCTGFRFTTIEDLYYEF